MHRSFFPISLSPISPSFLTFHHCLYPSQIHEAHIISVRALPPQQLNPELLGSLNMRKALLENYLTFPPIPHRVLRSDLRTAILISWNCLIMHICSFQYIRDTDPYRAAAAVTFWLQSRFLHHARHLNLFSFRNYLQQNLHLIPLYPSTSVLTGT
jgi:hypothetical protein